MTNGERRYDLKERTKEFALAVIELVGALPKSSTGRIVGDQLLRSATSVGANYREADVARSKAEFIAKIGDSLKESAETEYWLELLIESETGDVDRASMLLGESMQLTKILYSIREKAKR